MGEVQLFTTAKGTFRVFPDDGAMDQPASVFNCRTGMSHEFDTRAGAMAWIEGKPEAPQPRPLGDLTPEERAEAEQLDRKLDDEFGPDGEPIDG